MSQTFSIWVLLGCAVFGQSIHASPRFRGIPLAFEPSVGKGSFRGVAGQLTMQIRPGSMDFASAAERARHSLHVALEGANRKAAAQALEKLPSYSNYLIGADPARWRTHVPRFRGVRYREIYPGIDLVVYANGQDLEYDWDISPGADADVIRLHFDPRVQLRVDGSGDLIASLGSLELIQHRPIAYQKYRDRREDVHASYDLMPGSLVRMRLGHYDPALELTIDPVLSYAVAIGGSGYIGPGIKGTLKDAGNAIAVDKEGNAYVAGTTYSTDFPTTPGVLQEDNESVFPGTGFVFKLDSTGGLVFATYLGGAGPVSANAIALDSSGNIFVAGQDHSGKFPLVHPVKSAFAACGAPSCFYGFIAELDAQGSTLLFSTYVGGGGLNDTIESIAVGPSQNIAFAGETGSASLPTTAQALQPHLAPGICSGCLTGFIGELAPGPGNLAFLTYLGGSGGDHLAGIQEDASGAVYVAGSTSSTDFPVTASAFQSKPGAPPKGPTGFVAKLNSEGSQLIYSTYLGGSAADSLLAIGIEDQNAYVAGYSDSADFPVTPGTFQTAPVGPDSGQVVVAKLSVDGSSLVYSSFLGNGEATAITVRGGAAYVAGLTDSISFPVMDPVQAGTFSRLCPPTFAGCTDAFVTELNPDGSGLIYSTYLGGQSGSSASGIAVDTEGSMYVTGSDQADFPATPLPGTKQGSVFAVKISPQGVTPYFSYQSTTNAIGYASGPISPGELITIFGKNFTEPGLFTPSGLPLPTELHGVSVTVNGIAAPILAVANENGQEQINLQVPYGFAKGSMPLSAPIVVTTAKFGKSVPMWVNVEPAQQMGNEFVLSGSPGIVTAGGSAGAIQHGADFSLVTPDNPAQPGEVLILYASGLSSVTPPVESGAPALASPLSTTEITPSVSVGGMPATVLFSGLTPGYVGLYQINFRLAQSTPAGEDDVSVSSGSGVSNTVKIPVAR